MELKELHSEIHAKERNAETELNLPITVMQAPRVLKGTITINEALKLQRERDQFADKSIDETWLKLQIQAVLDQKPSLLGPYDGIDGCWKDEPCFVVGGSRGLKNAIDDGFRFEMLNGHHSIGVNHVISDYHNFEWWILQDKRFFDISPWDVLKNYKGRIFAHIRTRLQPSERITVTYTQEGEPTDKIINGLYSFCATGIAAINLAIVSGANPIYLLGVDNGGKKDETDYTHYKKDYPGAYHGGVTHWKKYLTTIPDKCEKFKPFADRIYNVDPLGDIRAFRKIAWREVKI